MAGKTPMQKIEEAGATPMRNRPGAGTGSALTYESLVKRYGGDEAKAREAYFRAALKAGYGNLRNMGYATLPPLDTTGLSAEGRAAMEQALADADAEFNAPTAEPEAAKE